ncbi:MAG: hypothetical protein WC515_03420 [Candidatus Omnitrophota bacterium]
MKRFVLVTAMLVFVSSFAYAQEAGQETVPAVENAQVTIKGDIIDNMCAGSKAPEALAEFAAGHTKECALMPACAASGYSIFADGKLTRFDKDSNTKVEEFLKNPDSKLQVVVAAEKVGDELKLVSIANQ